MMLYEMTFGTFEQWILLCTYIRRFSGLALYPSWESIWRRTGTDTPHAYNMCVYKVRYSALCKAALDGGLAGFTSIREEIEK